MRVLADGRTYAGRAVDLSAISVPPQAVVDAVRGDVASRVTVECPAPGPGHGALGVVGVGRPPSLRTSLAAAARSQGHAAPQDETTAALREKIRSAEAASVSPSVDGRSVRRRLADVTDREERLRERVAAARGRLAARREAGLDTEAASEAVASEIARLSEVETDRIAAEQALSRLEEELEAERDRRERRLALEDRLGALERDARAHLSALVYEAFSGAVVGVPGNGDMNPGASPSEFDGGRRLGQLGAIRVADLSAPVVLSDPRFGSAEEAAACLDVPVILV